MYAFESDLLTVISILTMHTVQVVNPIETVGANQQRLFAPGINCCR